MATTTDLLFRPALELAALVRSGELSARELVAASLERIDAVNPELNAFVDVFHDEALAAAGGLVGGGGDRRRGGHGPDRECQRRGRLDAHPRRVLRPRRPQAAAHPRL